MTDTLRNDRPWPLAGPDGPPPPPGAPGPGGADPEGTVIRNSPWRALVLLGALVGLAFLGLPIFLMVLAILVSVFLHEMGHYLAAKKTGMKVTEYFIGFGPKLWSFQRGETEYGVKAIPAGAYVRIIGMNNLEEVDPADEARTYRQAAYWRRLVAVFAGPAMNLLIAFSLMVGLFLVAGRADESAWTVGEAVRGGAAEAAGLEVGDDIVSVDGVAVDGFDSFGDIVTERAGDTVTVVYLRDGVEQTTEMTIGERLSAAGAAAFGGALYEDDIIRGVEGSGVADFDEVVERLEGRAGEQVDLEVERRIEDDGAIVQASDTVTVVVPDEIPENATRGFAGVARQSGERERLGPIEAVTAGAAEFGTTTVTVVDGFSQIFSISGLTDYAGRVFSTPPTANEESTEVVAPESELPPPATSVPSTDDANRFISILGIVQIGNSVAEESWVAFVGLVILMNVFLGLINLLPLPPLDGGHIAVATYEKIRSMMQQGRPYHADMAKLMPVTYAVFMVFVFIGLSSLYLDIVDPVQLGP